MIVLPEPIEIDLNEPALDINEPTNYNPNIILKSGQLHSPKTCWLTSGLKVKGKLKHLQTRPLPLSQPKPGVNKRKSYKHLIGQRLISHYFSNSPTNPGAPLTGPGPTILVLKADQIRSTVTRAEKSMF